MHISCPMDSGPVVGGRRMSQRILLKSLAWWLSALLLAVLCPGLAIAQTEGLVLERNGRVISLVPYAPNILRITMSTSKAAAIGRRQRSGLRPGPAVARHARSVPPPRQGQFAVS